MRTETVDITSDCNLLCKYCYQTKIGKLSLAQILKYTNQYDPKNVELGGGEPFMHEDIVPIVDELTEQNRKVIIATNGTIWNEKLIELPKNQRKLVNIAVSLPALDRGLYQKITGKDFVDKVIKNIEKYPKYFLTGINVPVYDDNFGDIENLINFANERDLEIRLNPVIPVGRAKNIKLLDKKQIEYMKNLIGAERLFSENVTSALFRKRTCCYALEAYYGIVKKHPCHAEANEKIYIAPDGSTKGCEFWGDQKCVQN